MTSDEVLAAVKGELFPEPVPTVVDGERVMSWSHVGYNLEGVIEDLKHGLGDNVCIQTLERISVRLAAASKLLDADIPPLVAKNFK